MKLSLPVLVFLVGGVGLAQAPQVGQVPLKLIQVADLLASGLTCQQAAILVEQQGIDFEPREHYLRLLKEIAGAEEILLKALRAAKQAKEPKSGPQPLATESLRAEQINLATLAEEEYRASLQKDPQNAVFHFDLAFALIMQNKSAEAIMELREAVKLKPDFLYGHLGLGLLLSAAGEGDASVTEFRKAVELKPDFVYAHTGLGSALAGVGDLDGALAEYRTAVRLKPEEASAHTGLGLTLDSKGDLGGAIAEYREGVRLDPDYEVAHYLLGVALEKKGLLEAALAEYRTAFKLAPYNPAFRASYERLSRELGR